MDELGVKHLNFQVNGIEMHVVEKGKGPVVLLLHGFPEFWYGWRYQLTGLAKHGFRAVAPDLCGYGDSSAPLEIASYTIFDLVGDVVALMDALEQPQVFVVGHDWGAILAWYLCMFRLDRVKALVNLSVPFIPQIGSVKPVQFLRAMYGDSFYICRFQETGVAEAEITRLGVDTFLKKVFACHKPEPFYIPEEGLGSPDEKITLPYWITEEEISNYVKSFEKTGFTGPLNYYRCLDSHLFDRSWDLMTPWSGAEVTVPTKFIIGDQDMTYCSGGTQMYVNLHAMKIFVRGLEDVAVLKGAGHFLHQERQWRSQIEFEAGANLKAKRLLNQKNKNLKLLKYSFCKHEYQNTKI